MAGTVAIVVATFAAVGAIVVAAVNGIGNRNTAHEANAIAKQNGSLEVVKVTVHEEGKQLADSKAEIEKLSTRPDALELERDDYKKRLALEELYSASLCSYIFAQLLS